MPTTVAQLLEIMFGNQW